MTACAGLWTSRNQAPCDADWPDVARDCQQNSLPVRLELPVVRHHRQRRRERSPLVAARSMAGSKANSRLTEYIGQKPRNVSCIVDAAMVPTRELKAGESNCLAQAGLLG